MKTIIIVLGILLIVAIILLVFLFKATNALGKLTVGSWLKGNFGRK